MCYSFITLIQQQFQEHLLWNISFQPDTYEMGLMQLLSSSIQHAQDYVSPPIKSRKTFMFSHFKSLPVYRQD